MMLNYSISEGKDLNIISLSGDLDLHLAPDLRKVLINQIKAKNNLVLNLKDVSYLDSSGIACFVEALQLSRKNNLQFRLSNISHAVHKVFALARLDTVFQIDDHAD
jgi:anti-sigma B factor antagonist